MRRTEGAQGLLSEITNDIIRVIEEPFKEMVCSLQFLGMKATRSIYVEELVQRPAALAPEESV
jgi:hypothetical protein